MRNVHTIMPAIAVTLSDKYGEGEGPILLNRVDCISSDVRLTDCHRLSLQQRPVSHSCTHSKDAGVICRGVSKDDFIEVHVLIAFIL